MFRRAVGSLLAGRFPPRAAPRTAPAHSLHSYSRDLAIGHGLLGAYVFAAGMLAGGGGGLVILHFKHGTDVDRSARAPGRLSHNVKFKKPDMKERFERWIIEHEKTYRDEEEKAMRFELFKASLESTEAQLPPVEESGVLPQVSCLADFTDEERRKLYGIQRSAEEYNQIFWAKQEKGEPC